MKKTKLAGSVTLILMVLMVWGALSIMANPGATGAVFVTSGAECGLEVEAGGEDVDVNRLNPGDVKESFLTVSNKGEGELTYYFDIIRTGGESGKFWSKNRDDIVETGKMLEDILEFTVLREGEDEPLFRGLLKDFDEQEMGKLQAGTSKDLIIKVYFPEEADNDYQDSSVKVKFAFFATCEAGGHDPGGDPGDDPGGGDDPKDPEEPLEPGDPDRPGGGGPSGPGKPSEPGEDPDVPEGLELDPEEPAAPPEIMEPGAPGESPDEELLVPEEDPPGAAGLPRTGQLPPWLWYGAGIGLIVAGLILHRRYRTDER